MTEISGPATRELDPSARKSRSPYTADRGAGKPNQREIPARIRVMTFVLSIYAPAEMSEAELERMTTHAHRIKEALALTAVTAVPICYSPAVDVEEIS
jgi:hypothetical protein